MGNVSLSVKMVGHVLHFSIKNNMSPHFNMIAWWVGGEDRCEVVL